MDSFALPALAVVAALALFWWLWHRRGSAGNEDGTPVRAQRADHLDTVAAWPPEATRVLTLQERRAFALLAYALPDHIILAQIPLARFIRVPTRNSYHEWMRRVGQLCADLVVCDNASQVIAVVEVRRPPGKDTERTRRRHDRMDRVLRKAGLRVIEWDEEALPHRDSVREQVLPTARPAGGPDSVPAVRPVPVPARPAPAAVPTGAAATPTTVIAARRPVMATLDDELVTDFEPTSPGERDETTVRNEPTPSTWFDELESERMPLHPLQR